MGTHAGLQQVSTSLTASHIPLGGAFKEKHFDKRTEQKLLKGLINLTAMLFISKPS